MEINDDRLRNWFGLFLKHKKYLCNAAPKTLLWYNHAFKNWEKAGCKDLSKTSIDQFVMSMVERGMEPGGANIHITAMNSFFRWLFDQELAPSHYKIKRLKPLKKIQPSYTESELTEIIGYKPKRWWEARIHTLLLFLIDTGCRVNEAITLTRDRVDLDSLAVKVTGKGSKERIVPISLELRKALFKFLQGHEHDLVFASKQGKKWDYQNVMRALDLLCKRVGVQAKGMHAFRRSFATMYVKEGGNLFYLQAHLGHERLETTRRYVRVDQEELQRVHMKSSPLSRLK